MNKIYVTTNTNCRRRILDTKKIKLYFQRNNWDVLDKSNKADWIIFVTCAYRDEIADDCLDKINHETPDLILLDIMMPGRPVADIVKQITHIKIVFMSVVRKTDAENKGLCDQDNVVDFLQKPFNLNDLIFKIETLLKNKADS